MTAIAGCSRPPAEPGRSPCPALIPGTSDALDDYADLVVWEQRTYIGDLELPGGDLARARLGRQVTTITCNVYDWSAENGGLRATPQPWPDGTATGLSVGTPVRAIAGVEARCALGARNAEGELRVFVAVDRDDESWPPLCR